MNDQITHKRTLLEELVLTEDAKLSEGKVLEVSKQLDILITEYYKSDSSHY